MDITYTVGTMRNAGLEAKWTKNNGCPFIAVRNPNGTTEHQRKRWYLCDGAMFEDMKKNGVLAGYESHTCLGDFFYI